jgi:aminoglycoside phosphotransferase (APT) family kinase protein
VDRQSIFSGTKCVADALRIDAGRIEAFLTEKIGGFDGLLSIEQFKGGQSNPTYLLTTPSRRFVLRRKPPGKLLPSAHAVDREFRVTSALHRSGFLIPRPILYCDDTSVVGTAFYLMDFVDGRIFWEPSMPGSNRSERAAVFDSMNATLARLHTLDPRLVGLSDFGKGNDYVARQVERWSRQYRASQTETVEEMDRLMAWLPENVPAQTTVRIVHGDYRLDNIVVARERPQVIAVLDWELATLGDPLADFAYHAMAWHMPDSDSLAGTATLDGHDLAALGIPALSEYADTYHDRTGFDPREYLDTYLAYNFFRIAAILQGIVGRVRDGTATSDHAPARSSIIRPLAAKAWDFALRAGA